MYKVRSALLTSSEINSFVEVMAECKPYWILTACQDFLERHAQQTLTRENAKPYSIEFKAYKEVTVPVLSELIKQRGYAGPGQPSL